MTHRLPPRCRPPRDRRHRRHAHGSTIHLVHRRRGGRSCARPRGESASMLAAPPCRRSRRLQIAPALALSDVAAADRQLGGGVRQQLRCAALTLNHWQATASPCHTRAPTMSCLPPPRCHRLQHDTASRHLLTAAARQAAALTADPYRPGEASRHTHHIPRSRVAAPLPQHLPSPSIDHCQLRHSPAAQPSAAAMAVIGYSRS